MALTAADAVLVYQSMLRGFEADQLQAEVLSEAGDDYQKQRLNVISKQIEVAEGRLETATKQAALDAADLLAAFVDANAPAGGWTDGYDGLTKAELTTEFARLGIVVDPDDLKAAMVNKLRAYDLHHTGVAAPPDA